MNYEIPKQTSVVRDTNGAGATGFVATNQGGHGYRMDRNTFEKHGNRETSMMAKKYFLKKKSVGHARWRNVRPQPNGRWDVGVVLFVS